MNSERMKKLLEYRDEVLLEFSEDEKKKIILELSRRDVERSFRGMPLNLIISMSRTDIDYLRDYGHLD